MSQQPQERAFTVSIPESQIHVIGRALEVLPYKEAAPVINNLQGQINVQLEQEQIAAEQAQAAADQETTAAQETASAVEGQKAE